MKLSKRIQDRIKIHLENLEAFYNYEPMRRHPAQKKIKICAYDGCDADITHRKSKYCTYHGIKIRQEQHSRWYKENETRTILNQVHKEMAA